MKNENNTIKGQIYTTENRSKYQCCSKIVNYRMHCNGLFTMGISGLMFIQCFGYFKRLKVQLSTIKCSHSCFCFYYFDQCYIYCPQTKLCEVNVFTSVCLFTGAGVVCTQHAMRQTEGWCVSQHAMGQGRCEAGGMHPTGTHPCTRLCEKT